MTDETNMPADFSQDNSNQAPTQDNSPAPVQQSAPEQQAPAPAPAPVSADPDHRLSVEEITELLHFDPVEKLQQLKLQGQQSAGQTPQQIQAQAPAPVAPAAPVAPVVPTTPVPAAAAPANTVPMTVEQLAQLTRDLQQQAQPQQPQQEPTVKPVYSVQLPDQIFAALDSDDPGTRRSAMNEVFNGFANMVHVGMQNYIHQVVVPHVRQEMSQTYTQMTTARQTEQDFYGTYPQLDNPVIRNVVQQVAIDYATELNKTGQFKGPTKEFNTSLAQRVQTLLSSVTGAPPQQQAPQTPSPTGQTPQTVLPSTQGVSVQQRPPFFTANGARPPVALNDQSAEIMDTLGIRPH